MSLDKTDLELIERLIYKNSDDIAVSIARSFERLEERIDDNGSRLYSRLADIEDKIPERRSAFSDYNIDNFDFTSDTDTLDDIKSSDEILTTFQKS